MGEVVSLAAFRKQTPEPVDELAEIIAWLEPAADWWTGNMQIELADSFRRVSDYRRILVGAKFDRDSAEYVNAKELSDKAFDAWRCQGLKQIFILAPTVRALRWKQEWANKNRGWVCPEVCAAIAKDEAALAGRLAAIARQQAGKAKRKAVLS